MYRLLPIKNQNNNLISATMSWMCSPMSDFASAWGQDALDGQGDPKIDHGILSLEMYVEPGTDLADIASFIPHKAVIKCRHCGQYGAYHTPCPHCGAPIE